MLGRKYLEDIKKQKEGLQQSISRQRAKIEEYDRVQPQSNDDSLEDFEYAQYSEFNEELERMKKQLQILRLEPDGFVLTKGNTKLLLEVTTRGEMMFFKIIPTTDPVIAPEMASFAYCKLELAEDGGFEVRYMESKRYIDELRKVIAKNTPPNDLSTIIKSRIPVLTSTLSQNILPLPIEPDSVRFEWKNGSDVFFTQDPLELVEVIGSHLNKHKKRAIAEVNKLKDLYDMKLIAYDSNNAEHEGLLMKLWTTLRPDEELSARKSSQWKHVGFQGTDPGTDFRGMGLLGLLNLLYFAETRTQQARQILDSHREYPFAVAGINITSMLLELMEMNDTINNKDAPVWDNEFLVFFCRAANDDANIHGFEEVYCSALEVLDKIWVDLDAKYMDFPRVLQLVKHNLRQVANARPADWEEFKNRIQQILITNGPSSPAATRSRASSSSSPTLPRSRASSSSSSPSPSSTPF